RLRVVFLEGRGNLLRVPRRPVGRPYRNGRHGLDSPCVRGSERQCEQGIPCGDLSAPTRPESRTRPGQGAEKMSIEATEAMSVKAAIEYLSNLRDAETERGSEEEVIIIISRP